jgi:hypothetical protein
MEPWDGIVERRRYRRVVPGEPLDCRIVVRARVQLLDLSHTGALLAADASLPVGLSGQLTTVLGGAPVATAVQVLGSRPPRHQGGRAIAARFRAMDDDSRVRLENFLSKANR